MARAAKRSARETAAPGFLLITGLSGAGRSEAELAECHQHESLLNLAFGAGPGWRLLCPYDVTALPDDVIEEARANHPLVLDGGRPVGIEDADGPGPGSAFWFELPDA